MRAAMQDYRERTTLLLVVGLFAVAGVLAIHYRGVRLVLAVMTPAVLAAGLTIAVLAALQMPLDLVGLTAVLMVLSIGVDYGVFLAETERAHPEALSATLLGLLVCWATTVLGFGVLTLSAHPVMKTIGVVAGVGVTASLLLAPTTLALLPRRRA
jgi:predicted exporter